MPPLGSQACRAAKKARVHVPRVTGDGWTSASIEYYLGNEPLIRGGLTALNRTEAMHLKADILTKVREAFTPPPGEYSEVEIFRETAGQIMLRARKPGADDRHVMLMVTVTELRSWK
jgi:hypothetical protein